jgi:hypothetical protein
VQFTLRLLVGIGALLQAMGLWYLIVRVDLLCYDMCPEKSALAATVAARFSDAAPFALLFALPMGVAWLLCLVQLARLRHWAVLILLALALLAVAGLALLVFVHGTGGQALPTTWARMNLVWNVPFQQAMALLLLWPLATFAATFALRGRQSAE